VTQRRPRVYTRRVPRYDVPKAAPEPLRLVQRFVNTVDREHEREWLGSPAELGTWLREGGLAAGQPNARLLRRAHDVREALRELLVANNHGVAPPADAVATVNAVAAAGRLAPRLREDGRLSVAQAAQGSPVAPLARIVGVAFEAMLEGNWPRLKACRNCRWAFYDYSRNRAATWCSMTLCGNRLKARSYRRRGARGRVPRR
jgi:predicted RNA-binding Zn ribbon-like protein